MKLPTYHPSGTHVHICVWVYPNTAKTHQTSNTQKQARISQAPQHQPNPHRRWRPRQKAPRPGPHDPAGMAGGQTSRSLQHRLLVARPARPRQCAASAKPMLKHSGPHTQTSASKALRQSIRPHAAVGMSPGDSTAVAMVHLHGVADEREEFVALPRVASAQVSLNLA